jgi:hypothetical protein
MGANDVTLLYHAGGKFGGSIDVLPYHEEHSCDLEIGQDLQHPFRVRIYGPSSKVRYALIVLSPLQRSS